jgi:uncharacterized protein involved in exopolysaccharide biosynthesis/Mrp family chromosome partitioning ATPase
MLSNDTEAAILTSTNLADRVIDELGLSKLPFFLGPVDGELSDQERLNRVYSQYFRNLTVRPADRSRVIDIRFVADDPHLAANVANTLARAYIDEHSQARRQSATRETLWLTERVEELRNRVKEAQRKVDEFKSKHGVLDLGNMSMVQRQVADTSQQLGLAQTRRAELEEKAHQLSSLNGQGGGVSASAAALDSANIRQLRAEETDAARRVSELSQQYGSDHPRYIQAVAQLDEVHAKINAELGRIVAAASNDARLAKDQEDQLSKRLSDLKAELEKQVSTEESLNVLTVDLRTTSEFYGTLLNRLREANSLDDRIEAPHARVISAALPPDQPFYPRKMLVVAAIAAVAAVIGVMLAFLMEAIDVGFRNSEQIEELTGLETIASVPTVRMQSSARRLADMPKLFYDEPVLAEAVRYVRVALSLTPQADRPVRSILVTSALPREGKTFASRALAVTCALGGSRVITVNCDLRKRRVWRRRAEQLRKPGLVEYLRGTAEIGDIISLDETSGVHCIDCGSTDVWLDAPFLLGSERMRQLMAILSDTYDMVLLDAPPIKIFPDALVLQQLVDKVYFIIRWAHTRREICLDALKVLIQAGYLNPVVGLTQVNLRQLPRFDYRVPSGASHSPDYLHSRILR